MKQEFNSAKTSINSTKVPAIFKKITWTPGTKNLDWGGGKFDTATEWLKALNVDNYIYDPYNRTEAHNASVLAYNDYDSVTISNVLNVIKEANIRHQVVQDALTHLKPGGALQITVYEGDQTGHGRPTKSGCWQENRKLIDYIPELACFFPIIKKGMIVIIK